MNIYDNNLTSIEYLYSESLNKYFEKDDLFKRLKFISDEFDKEVENIEGRLKNNHFKKSCLHKIFKVHERVRLVRDFENQLAKDAGILRRFMYPGLKTYLLLTCFDQLGQDDKGWRFFPVWLNSEKCKRERDEILLCTKLEENVVDTIGNANPRFIESVYNKYHEIYGVKNSFMNFLRYLLPQDQKNKLLGKILFEIYSVKDGEFHFEEYGTELDKEKWLFKTRNDYTHNLLTAEKHFQEGFLDIDDNWIIWEETHSNGQAQRILAKESFKKEIEESILIGIVEIIKHNS